MSEGRNPFKTDHLDPVDFVHNLATAGPFKLDGQKVIFTIGAVTSKQKPFGIEVVAYEDKQNNKVFFEVKSG